MRTLPSLARIVPVLLLVIAMFLGPLAPSGTAQDDEPVHIVTSFSVLADIVRQIGGDHVDVTSLVPAGGDAHAFDPSPDQVRTLEDAELIVSVGDDFEPWLNNLLDNIGRDTPHIEAFGSAIDHDIAEHDDAHEDHDDPDGHDHADEVNEDDHNHSDEIHHWLDVHTTIHTVIQLADALAEVDPDNADDYHASAEAYMAELEELDAYIADQTATIPAEQRLLVTVHSSMGAFADAYGFEIAGVLLESHSTEGADASAGHVAELVAIIQDNDIPAIFPDTPGGADLLAPVASEADVEIASQLYIDTLAADDDGPQSYVDMMRHNIDVIAAALNE